MRFREHDIEIPQVLLDLGFQDASWHNDDAARMFREHRDFQIDVWTYYPEHAEEYGYKYSVVVGIEASDEMFEIAKSKTDEELRQLLLLMGVADES